MKTSVSVAILIALALCSFVPFAARAVYLDEPIYLHFGKAILENHWTYPHEPDWIFFGIPMSNTAMRTHPPAGEYCLAVLFKLFGSFHNAPFRLIWGIFSIIAVLAFYRLARHFTSDPLPVAALFAASPAFFLMSPTLMMDIPMLAFLLAGLGFYLDGIQKRRAHLYLVPVCFALSLGMGYTALVPIGCLFIWAVFRKRPLLELLAIGAGPACLLLQQVAMMRHSGIVPMTELFRYFSSQSAVASKILPTLSFLGGVSLFPWALLALTDLSKKWIIAGAGVIAAVILSFFYPAWPSPLYRVWYLALASCGITWLFVFILESGRRIPNHPMMRGFLIMWAPAGILFFMLMGEFVSARYFLLSLPPLFLIAFAQIRRRAAAVALAATLILSLSLAIADYRYVNSYPRWVARTIVPLQQQGFRIWSAAESGLRFYLNRIGIQSLTSSSNEPQAANLIVRQDSFALGLSGDLEPLLLPLREDTLEDACILRTYVKPSAAGFHDSQFGMVPYSFSRSRLDRIQIVEVSPFVTHLPQVVPPDYCSVPLWFQDGNRNGVQLKQCRPEMKFPVAIPKGATVDYQLEGEGSMELTESGITLKKTNAAPAIFWKNFRIVPAGF
jgi:4-amino-4-deoxy-L-arabinose transferase-like glycosyltransferase